MPTVKRKKVVDERKQKKSMAEHVDLSDVSTKALKRKIKEGALRKRKSSNQKIQPEEARMDHDNTIGDVGEEKQAEKATGRGKKDEALRKNKKKRKLQKIEPEQEQNCDDNVEGNADENGKSEEKQRKTKEKKRRNVVKATEDNICKTKKAREAVEHLPTKGDQDLHLEKNEDEDEIYQIPSEDETPVQGMRKWITNYYQSRPGLNALQEKIDDFITAHEAQEEQARIEKEEQAAEGGWTVVVHHKGRKKTTDAESGIAVGSVSQAAVMEKMATKKNKDVGLDFYRFQKREAKRNEIVMLRSKFEQDKKRVQELRAQRKFKPY